MTIDEHDIAVQAAERDLADLKAQIAAGKAEHQATAPAAAVRDGIPLAEAGPRHAAAERHVAFLLDAEDATAYEVAKLAIETAEIDYETANQAIDEAISRGLDRPPHLRENPLRLSWTIDHRTRVQLQPYASEAALWERYL